MFPLSDKLMVCFKEDRIQMLKIFLFCIRTVFLLAYRLWTCISYLITKQTKAVRYQQTVKYENYPLSPLSMHRLSLVRRKVFVLDLDETLIHSNHDGVIRQANKSNIPPDFILRVTIERHPVRFFVHKRPFVDFFLDIVSQWYELVVFTASMEVYGAGVADKLDNNRGILKRRYYRQHCTPELGSYTKDLSAITGDLSNIFILDNSPGAYKGYPDNAIPIKSWFCDQSDTALLGLLPVLDALRFTHDVRSVLSRKLHLHRLCNGCAPTMNILVQIKVLGSPIELLRVPNFIVIRFCEWYNINLHVGKNKTSCCNLSDNG